MKSTVNHNNIVISTLIIYPFMYIMIIRFNCIKLLMYIFLYTRKLT